jgi:ribonuclease D
MSPDQKDKSTRNPLSYRSAHRNRSHDSAHAEPAVAHAGRTLNHPLVPKGPAALVDSAAEFRELIDHLRSCGRFAYDSEFIGELTYVPKLCLIQVASAGRVVLIDPLAGLELNAFWELIADPGIEKIVHAGQQDLEPVVRHLNRPPANVFDTQICAGFIGLPYPLSLLKLVNELAGVKLGKGLTFSHWDQRPLSPMQLRYAADDVRYLVLVRDEIGKRLATAGHTDWATEECANQCDPRLFAFDPRQQYLRVRGAGSLPPRNLAVLRELTIWRDAAARLNDVPPRAFLKDEIMIELSRNPVKSIDKLDRVRGLPRPVESQHGARIVELTASAMGLPQSELPPVRDIEPSPGEKFRTDSLWAVAQALCAGQLLDVAAVTNRQEINEFYRHFTTPSDGAEPHRLVTGWRRQALGEPLLSILRGEAQVQLAWAGGSLRSTRLHD